MDGTKPANQTALKPEFDWVVDCKLAMKPEFCCLLPTPGGVNVTSGFALPMLRPMAAMAILLGAAVIVLAFAAAMAAMAAIDIHPGDKGITLAFATTAVKAATFVGGEVGVCAVIGIARRKLGCDKLWEY